MATQWHPLFAELLRPLVEEYYEVRTNMPVGDMPREADLVLLRRTTAAAPPFQGLWRHLTPWNILEYKGPSVSARFEHLDLLIELGLGIHRRLNEERAKEKRRPVPASEVSFWYFANHLGRRFHSEASRKVGALEACGEGVWRTRCLDRQVFLISGVNVPVEHDSVPLHILASEPLENELALARLLIQQPMLFELYGHFLGSLHPETLKELKAMARTASKEPKFHVKPLIEWMGIKEVIDQVGLERVIDEVGVKRVIDEVGANRLIDEMITDRAGKRRLLSHLLDILSAAERTELKRRLEAKDK
jgi:hypothetical protein